MSIERVREYFKKYGIENRIQEFDVSSATVELAGSQPGTRWRVCLAGAGDCGIRPDHRSQSAVSLALDGEFLIIT